MDTLLVDGTWWPISPEAVTAVAALLTVVCVALGLRSLWHSRSSNHVARSGA